jgi:hypothetical protein
MRLHAPRFLISAAAAALIAGGCGDGRDEGGTGSSSTSPPSVTDDPWVAVEPGFLDTCAQTEDHPAEDAFCRCVYIETVEFYGTPEAMVEATASRPTDGPPTDPLLEAAFEGCADAHVT